LRNRIKARSRLSSALLAGLLSVPFASRVAQAHPPSVADLDATARAAGNRLDVAHRVGESVFRTTWPAQVSQISANGIGKHVIVGIRVWGVKFHHPITRKEFVSEVAALVERAFAAAPEAEEVDLWASVPIAVGKGVIVSGDLAKPTTRTVFSISVRRGETPQSVLAHIAGSSAAFWDQEWERSAFKSGLT
jgi:hypothetical protein